MRILTLLCLLLGQQALAQPVSSMLSRRADEPGAYPVYIGAGGSAILGSLREFQRIGAVGVLPERFNGAGGRFRTWGMAFKLGAVIARGRPFFSALPPSIRPNNILVEADINNYVKDLRAKQEGTFLLHTTSASIRVGTRLRLFYPVVLQFTAGPVLFQSSSMFLNFTGERYGGATTEVDQGFGFKGIEYRARLSFFDPAGTGGGVGLYFEFQATDVFRNVVDHLGPMYEAAGVEGLDPRPNLDYRALNIGLVVPLALPFR